MRSCEGEKGGQYVSLDRLRTESDSQNICLMLALLQVLITDLGLAQSFLESKHNKDRKMVRPTSRRDYFCLNIMKDFL